MNRDQTKSDVDVLEPEVTHEKITKFELPAGVKSQPKSKWQKADCPYHEPGCQRKSTIELFVVRGDKKIPQGTKRSCENPACVSKAAEVVQKKK